MANDVLVEEDVEEANVKSGPDEPPPDDLFGPPRSKETDWQKGDDGPKQARVFHNLT